MALLSMLPAGAAQQQSPMRKADEAVNAADCVLIVTGHTSIDYKSIAAKAKLIIDACNVAPHQANVVRLGAPA